MTKILRHSREVRVENIIRTVGGDSWVMMKIIRLQGEVSLDLGEKEEHVNAYR